jgi:hypothetical protein
VEVALILYGCCVYYSVTNRGEVHHDLDSDARQFDVPMRKSPSLRCVKQTTASFPVRCWCPPINWVPPGSTLVLSDKTQCPIEARSKRDCWRWALSSCMFSTMSGSTRI